MSQNEVIANCEIIHELPRITNRSGGISHSTNKEWQYETVEPFQSSKLVGVSTHHRELIHMIDRYKDSDASILITGETGTGKELVARLLHESSSRANYQCETFNCSAVPVDLIEPEIFGPRSTALLDEPYDSRGLIERCTGGTLILEGINEMPLSTQARILQVLQSKVVGKIGTLQSVPVRTRIIGISNRRLKDDVEAGVLRSDLFYNLSVLTIHIPPLRDRPEDIPVLVDHFLTQLSEKYGDKKIEVTSSDMARLKEYPWPGNVRELCNAIERAYVMSNEGTLDLDYVFETPVNFMPNRPTYVNWDEAIPINYHRAKTSFEKQYLSNLLLKTQGNVSEAARLAGKTRVEIYRFLSRNQIKPADFRTKQSKCM